MSQIGDVPFCANFLDISAVAKNWDVFSISLEISADRCRMQNKHLFSKFEICLICEKLRKMGREEQTFSRQTRISLKQGKVRQRGEMFFIWTAACSRRLNWYRNNQKYSMLYFEKLRLFKPKRYKQTDYFCRIKLDWSSETRTTVYSTGKTAIQ